MVSCVQKASSDSLSWEIFSSASRLALCGLERVGVVGLLAVVAGVFGIEVWPLLLGARGSMFRAWWTPKSFLPVVNTADSGGGANFFIFAGGFGAGCLALIFDSLGISYATSAAPDESASSSSSGAQSLSSSSLLKWKTFLLPPLITLARQDEIEAWNVTDVPCWLRGEAEVTRLELEVCELARTLRRSG
jgi:hypothetical protein